MTLRLNENRPYGSIHPPLDGAFYEQDGQLFDQNKVALNTAGAVKGAAKSAPSSSEAKKVSQTSEIDLDAWAKGEVNAPWFAVKKAALAKHPGIDTANADALKAALAGQSAAPEGSD
jgi:hypothetical protein